MNLSPRTYGFALIAAGVTAGLAGLALVAILTWGFGSIPALQPAIVAILGKALMGVGVVMVVVIGFLGIGGPIRFFKAALGKFSLETEGD